MTGAAEPQRILLVTRNFPPLVGGAERLLWNVFDQLSRAYEIDVVGPAGCEAFVRRPHRAHPCPARRASWFLAWALVRACRLARRRRYSLLVAGSALTAPVTSALSRLHGTASVTFVHGLDLVAESFLYRSIMTPAVRASDRLVANSRHTRSIAASLGIPRARIAVLHPGVDLPSPPPPVEELSRKLGLKGRGKILLFVGRLVPRKGLREFLERCLPDIALRHPDVLLLVIGESPAMALSRGHETLDELRALASSMNLDRHVRFLGRTSEATLRAAYQLADILVLPVREVAHDVEGFGMVAVEAAAHGTPTIGFRAGGVPDAVEEGTSGLLVDAGDHEALVDAIGSALANPGSLPSAESCRRFARRCSWESFGTGLLTLCEEVRRG